MTSTQEAVMTKDERLEILLRCLHVRWPVARDLSNSSLRDIANAFEDAIAEIAAIPPAIEGEE